MQEILPNGKFAPSKNPTKKTITNRGTTIPPTLTGGIGGIHYYKGIPVSEKDMEEKRKAFLQLDSKNIYRNGDRVAFKNNINLSHNDFLDAVRSYKLSNTKPESSEVYKKQSKPLFPGREIVDERAIARKLFFGDDN